MKQVVKKYKKFQNFKIKIQKSKNIYKKLRLRNLGSACLPGTR